MKRILINLWLLLIAGASNPTFAQSYFNYQGVVRDSSGAVLDNQDLGIQISIVPNQPNGTPLYHENHYPTSNDYGVFQIEVGNGQAPEIGRAHV